MPNGLKFSFACHIGEASTMGHIVSSEGHVVIIPETEIPSLLLDLAADGECLPGRRRHHLRVLEEWFTRKTQIIASAVRLVSSR